MAEAARRAKLSDYAAAAYPAQPSWAENLMNRMKSDDYLEQKVQATLGEYYAPLRFVSTLKSPTDMLQARMFFVPNLK